MVHPSDHKMIKEYFRDEIIAKGAPFDKEYRIIRQNDAQTRWVHCLGKVNIDTDNKVKSLVGTVRDVTARKAKEEALRKLNRTLIAMNKSSQAMSHSKEENDYLNQVCKIVVENTEFSMVWIGYAMEDEVKTICPIASAGIEEDYLESIRLSWDDSQFGRGPTGTAIRTGNISICNNILTNPDFEPWREQALKRGFASSIVFPLKTAEKTFGALTIYSNQPDIFWDEEIKLLSKLANDLAHGIITIRLRSAHKMAEEALKKSHNELEVLVKKRTLELQATNELLKKEIQVRIQQEQNLIIAEEKYRTVADYTYGWEYWINAVGNFTYVSPSCERISGYHANEFIDDPNLQSKIIYEADKKIWKKYEEKAHTYKSGEINSEFNFRIVTKSGDIRWIACVYQKVFINDKYLGIRASNRDITDKIKADNQSLNLTLTVEEHERNHFARELHDGLGPLLSTIKLYFNWLAETTDVEKVKMISEKGNYYIECAIQTTHDMALGLSSLVLSKLGYVKTVLNYAQSVRELQDISVNFTFNSKDRFGYRLETTLYRITIELINNTIKHAKATCIEIALNYQLDISLISFSYSDNGIGFDLAEIQKNGCGLGILNMQQRVNILKGKMQINSGTGSGVMVNIELPVTEHGDGFEYRN